MNGYFLRMILCTAAFSLNSVCTRLFQVRFRNSEHWLPLYQALFCILASMLFLVVGKPEIPAWDTVTFGVLFGLFFFGAVRFLSLGFTCGSMALTSVIVNMSLLIPVLYSLIFLSEPFSWCYLIGILLFAVTFLLSSGFAGGERIQSRWLFCVFCAFFCNGITAVIQKQYTLTSASGQSRLLMTLAYFTAGMCFLIQLIVGAKKKLPAPIEKQYFAGLLGIAALSGIGSFGGNLLLTDLSGKVSGGVLYPCVNGGLCLLLTLASCMLFREKLTLRNILAIICGITAIVILNLATPA